MRIDQCCRELDWWFHVKQLGSRKREFCKRKQTPSDSPMRRGCCSSDDGMPMVEECSNIDVPVS